MTKSWQEVRERILQLYTAECRPLTEVQGILLKECHFKASVRAYRMKLKEWESLRSSNAPMTSVIPRPSETRQSERRQSESRQSGRRQSDESPAVNTSRSFDEVLQNLKIIGTDIDSRDSKGRTPLEIAIQSNSIVTVEGLLSSGASVSSKNSEGKQPLHVALTSIISNKVAICELLLRFGAPAYDALLQNPRPERRPLRLLRSPMRLFMDCLADQHNTIAHNANYSLLKKCLEKGVDDNDPWQRLRNDQFLRPTASAPIDRNAFAKFVDSLQSPWALEKGNMFWRCFRLFLEKGFDPAVPVTSVTTWCKGSCWYFTSLVFFHASSFDYARTLIDNIGEHHLTNLAYQLLNPCLFRVRTSNDQSLTQLMRALLSRMDLPQRQALFPKFLDSLQEGTEDAVEMLETLLEFGGIDVNAKTTIRSISTSSSERPIACLLKMSDRPRLRAAEILFNPEFRRARAVAKPTQPAAAVHNGLFPLGVTDEYAEYSESRYCNHLNHYLRWPCVSHSTSSPGALYDCNCRFENSETSLLTERALRIIQRCVVHIVTADMIRDPPKATNMLKGESIHRALLLRKKFQLPDVAIDNQALCAILDEYQNYVAQYL